MTRQSLSSDLLRSLIVDILDFGHIINLPQSSWKQHIRVVDHQIQPGRTHHRFPGMKLPGQRPIGLRHIQDTAAAPFTVLQLDGLIYILLTLFFLSKDIGKKRIPQCPFAPHDIRSTCVIRCLITVGLESREGFLAGIGLIVMVLFRALYDGPVRCQIHLCCCFQAGKRRFLVDHRENKRTRPGRTVQRPCGIRVSTVDTLIESSILFVIALQEQLVSYKFRSLLVLGFL